jgi:hypothetical protein
MFKGFGDHRIGQHHEDGAPGKHIDERLCGIGKHFRARQNPPVMQHRRLAFLNPSSIVASRRRRPRDA